MLTFHEIFDLALKSAMKNDPRPKREIDIYLENVQREYKALPNEKKKYFDMEKLTNPYPDSRVLFDPDKKKKMRKVLVGIDIGTEDFCLLRELNRDGAGIDGVIAHHPCGMGRMALPDNMHIQYGIAYELGVPINVGEKLLFERIEEVDRRLAPANNHRPVDTAKLLGMHFGCIHTAADNHVHTFIDTLLKKKKIVRVGEIVDALMEVPEFQESSRLGMPPKIYAGKAASRAGKIAVTGMTGGTEGSLEIYERLAQAGVGTVVEMHISDDRMKNAKKCHLNVVMSGHMASDSLGMNLIMDQIEKKGTKVLACSGYIRVKR